MLMIYTRKYIIPSNEIKCTKFDFYKEKFNVPDPLGKHQGISTTENTSEYRSGTVNSKSFVGKVLLRIKWKFELN